MTKLIAVLVLVPCPVRALALRVAVLRRLALAADHERCRCHQAVLASVLQVLRLDHRQRGEDFIFFFVDKPFHPSQLVVH